MHSQTSDAACLKRDLKEYYRMCPAPHSRIPVVDSTHLVAKIEIKRIKYLATVVKIRDIGLGDTKGWFQLLIQIPVVASTCTLPSADPSGRHNRHAKYSTTCPAPRRQYGSIFALLLPFVSSVDQNTSTSMICGFTIQNKRHTVVV
ncbi:hypothetical protein J6590_030998 [Homalodisca vitripennis]|nr:hypothetical protein J6590_030998 [Homalodisca vitripennis]